MKVERDKTCFEVYVNEAENNAPSYIDDISAPDRWLPFCFVNKKDNCPAL
jgi:hypothetical protein